MKDPYISHPKIGTLYYDKDGSPLEMMEWAKKIQEMDYKIVARTANGDVLVSTVWLGIDHAFGDHPPIIFETMVFRGDHDGEMARYSTIEEAREGHRKMCEMVFPATPGPLEEK